MNIVNIKTIKNLNQINKIIKSNDMLEVKLLKKYSFKNKLDDINIIKKLMILIQSEYDFNTIKNNIEKNKLNISLKTTLEGIKKINSINLFKSIGLKENVKEEFNLPFNFIKYQLISNSKIEVENKLNLKNKNNILIEQCIEDSTIFTIYELKKCYYKIIYSKYNKEYYIALYNNKDNDDYYTKYYFIDLVNILFFNNYKETIAKLFEILNIAIIDSIEFINMCNNNINFLESNINNYNFLKKVIYKHIYIIKSINDISIIDYYFKNDIKNKNEVFFSQRYLAKICNKSQSTIVPYLNAFVLLGFYNKRIVNNNNFNNNGQVIYEILPITNETLIRANNIAKLLKNNKLSMSKINQENIRKIFNEEISSKIFLDKIIKGENYNE